jgi:hypothetical protein
VSARILQLATLQHPGVRIHGHAALKTTLAIFNVYFCHKNTPQVTQANEKHKNHKEKTRRKMRKRNNEENIERSCTNKETEIG